VVSFWSDQVSQRARGGLYAPRTHKSGVVKDTNARRETRKPSPVGLGGQEKVSVKYRVGMDVMIALRLTMVLWWSHQLLQEKYSTTSFARAGPWKHSEVAGRSTQDGSYSVFQLNLSDNKRNTQKKHNTTNRQRRNFPLFSMDYRTLLASIVAYTNVPFECPCCLEE